MNFENNQKAQLTHTHNGSIIVTLQQTISTPGACIKTYLIQNTKYRITVSGFKQCTCDVKLYICLNANNIILYSVDYSFKDIDTTIIYEFMSPDNGLCKIGMLASKCTYGDTFVITNFKFDNLTNLYEAPINDYIENKQKKEHIIMLIDKKENKSSFSTNISSINNNDIEYFLKYGFCQLRTSESLIYFHKKIISNYHLKEVTNYNLPCIFFGIYDVDDFEHIRKAKSKFNLVIWGGTDLKIFATKPWYEQCKKILLGPNFLHIAISNCLYLIGKNHGFSMIEKNITCISFKIPIESDIISYDNTKEDDCFIYCYDGNKRSVYNIDILKKIENLLPEYKFIYASECTSLHKIDHIDMPDIYNKCFVILRLTDYDGNANTVMEGGLFGVPPIHNGDYKYSIKWNKNDVDTIIKNIKDAKEYKLDKRREIHNYYYNLYKNLLSQDFLRSDYYIQNYSKFINLD
jgi:hypothetical protein